MLLLLLPPLRDNSSSQDSKSSSSGNRRELFKRPLFLLPLSNGYASPDGNCNRNKKDFPTFRWALGKQVKRVKKSSEEAALPHNRSSPPHHTHTHGRLLCFSFFFPECRVTIQVPPFFSYTSPFHRTPYTHTHITLWRHDQHGRIINPTSSTHFHTKIVFVIIAIGEIMGLNHASC